MTGTVQWLQAGGIGVGTWVVWAALAKLAIDGPPERHPVAQPTPAPLAEPALAAEQSLIPAVLPTPPADAVQTLQLHEVKAYRARHAKGRPTCT